MHAQLWFKQKHASLTAILSLYSHTADQYQHALSVERAGRQPTYVRTALYDNSFIVHCSWPCADGTGEEGEDSHAIAS
jgi:hypothetical protein